MKPLFALTIVSSQSMSDQGTFLPSFLSSFLPILFFLGCFVIEQISHNDCCVINHLLFVHPPLARFLDKSVNSIYRSFLCFDHVDCLLIVDKLPKTIGCHDNEFVCGGIQLTFGEFGFRDDTSRMCYDISQRPAKTKKEGKARTTWIERGMKEKCISCQVSLQQAEVPAPAFVTYRDMANPGTSM
jgi:hypothetical protein